MRVGLSVLVLLMLVFGAEELSDLVYS